jgi:hypothetical protein
MGIIKTSKLNTMKNLVIFILTLFILMSCGDKLTDLNKDIKNPEEVPAGALFANAIKDLFDYQTDCNVNINNFRLWSQQWAQTTYDDESNYELVERNVNGRAWNEHYAEIIRDLNDAKKFIEEDANLPDEAKKNQTAMAEVLQVYAYHVLVDTFGDIPYTEALGDDVTPGYDSDVDIYNDIINRLNTAINSLSGESRMGSYDLVYGGDVDMWRMFANSLKLRLAMRLANVNPSLSQSLAEAAAGGVFTSNADHFALLYQNAPPNTNQLWDDLVQSGRSDFIAASTLTDPMNALNDPRLPFYYKDPIDGVYQGGIYGTNNNYNAFSHPGLLQEDPTWPGIILSYWEVAFLLADAAERGYSVPGSAAEWYSIGIEASILYWGATQAEADAYLANPDVAFATAAGTDREKIALQKWISLYDQGFEAWCSYRLYNHPDLPPAARTGRETPRRFTYPVTEYSLNEESVQSAATAIGGDDLQTKVFWDVN